MNKKSKKEEQEIKMKVKTHIGVLNEISEKGWRKEINIVNWYDEEEDKIDIRQLCRDDNNEIIKLGKGITLTINEFSKLKEYISDITLDSTEE
jgi:hypothetical protein